MTIKMMKIHSKSLSDMRYTLLTGGKWISELIKLLFWNGSTLLSSTVLMVNGSSIFFLFFSWLIWNNATFPCFSYGVPFILSSVQTSFLTISLPLLLWAGGKKNKERETGWLTEKQSWLIKQVHKLNAIFHISITIDYFNFAVNLWAWLFLWALWKYSGRSGSQKVLVSIVCIGEGYIFGHLCIWGRPALTRNSEWILLTTLFAHLPTTSRYVIMLSLSRVQCFQRMIWKPKCQETFHTQGFYSISAPYSKSTWFLRAASSASLTRPN